jgi:hypothetical protein
MARETVILDNLYCNGEVSQDGHQWSNAAYATDYTQKAWVTATVGAVSRKPTKVTSSPAVFVG